MEESPAHFLHYNTPLVNEIVDEINDFVKENTQQKITNEDLIPVLTKNILPLLQKAWVVGEETFTHIQDAYDPNSSEDDNSVMYYAEPSMAHLEADNGAVFGFIFIKLGDENLLNVYLVKYVPQTNKFTALFEFQYGFTDDGEMRNPKFTNIKIVDLEGGLHKALTYLANQASFNNYSNPPPYVVFAKMIS
jgi:hypothetical protein